MWGLRGIIGIPPGKAGTAGPDDVGYAAGKPIYVVKPYRYSRPMIPAYPELEKIRVSIVARLLEYQIQAVIGRSHGPV
jgi:hypothetical protein